LLYGDGLRVKAPEAVDYVVLHHTAADPPLALLSVWVFGRTISLV
jgi:hypothetical protein